MTVGNVMDNLFYGPSARTVSGLQLIAGQTSYRGAERPWSLSDFSDECRVIRLVDRRIEIELSNRVAKIDFLNCSCHGSEGRELCNALREVHGDRRAVRDERGCRSSSQYTRKWLIVKFPERALELPARVRPDVPARMLDSILNRATITLSGISPGTVAQKIYVRSDANALCGPVYVNGKPTLVTRSTKSILD